MKNTMRCLGIVALAAVIGFSVIACDTGMGSVDSALNGTWANNEGYRINFNNGSFTMYDGSVQRGRGTYTTGGNILTLTITGIYFGAQDAASMGLPSTSRWYTRAELRTAMLNAWGSGMASQIDSMLNSAFTTVSGPYSVSGNTLNWDGSRLTRQ